MKRNYVLIIKDTNIKERTVYIFNDTINIKNFDPNNIKIGKKSNKIIFTYCIGYVTMKDFKTNSVNTLNLIFIKMLLRH